MSGFPLDTPRFYIRPFVEEDAEGLHVVYGDQRVMERIPSGTSKSVEETKRRIQKLAELQAESGYSLWGIFDKQTNEIVGNCGLFPVEGKGPEIEVAYDIAYDHWGKGIATEATIAVLDYGLNELKIDEILALTFTDHKASMRVMEKSGMKYRGEENWYNITMVVYTISKDD